MSKLGDLSTEVEQELTRIEGLKIFQFFWDC